MAVIPAEFEQRLARLGVREGDLRIAIARASGPGGQHVNKVSTAVTIFHDASGTSAVASDSRSQSTNRYVAVERLLEKLEAQRAAKQQERRAAASKRRAQRGKRPPGVKRKILADKKKRSETKAARKKVSF
ncbi:MAG: peptide chain release factor-like protein [Chthoniobacterales bacterium]